MTTDLKNVVIIGGCSAGSTLARLLEKTLPADSRLVLIEKNEFAYWPVGGLRAAVKPGFEDQIFASFDKFFKEGSRHIVLAGYNVVEITETTVKLDKAAPAPLGSDTITIEAGVLATGSHYAIPMRPMSTKLQEAKEGLKKMQEDVKKSNDFLIIGAGPVGIEFCGEIKDIYPDKNITLVDKGPSLLPRYRAPLGKNLLPQLKQRKVDVRFKSGLELTQDLIDKSQRHLSEKIKIKLDDGHEVETDFLFLASGGKANTDIVPSDALEEGKLKKVDVNPSTLRLTHASLGKKWFAIGDVSNGPGTKTHVNAQGEAAIAAAQLVGLINGSGSTKSYKSPVSIMMVPIGQTGGASQVVWPVLGSWFTKFVKGKGLFVSSWLAVYPGGQAK